MNQICFERDRFHMYVILTVLLFGSIFVVYANNQSKEAFTGIDVNAGLPQADLLARLKKSQNDLNKSNIELEYCKSDLMKKSMKMDRENNIENNGPVRDYSGSDDYQQIGFIYNNIGRFPLFGRRKYRGRSDKWEYYLIDDSRNYLRIEVKSTNFNELYNGDTITVPQLGADTFNIEIYDYNGFRYVG